MEHAQVLDDMDIRRYETDHRIANSLQFLAATLRHESRQISDVQSARQILDNTACRLAATARLHREISKVQPEGDVKFSEAFEGLCSEISEVLGVHFICATKGVVIQASMVGDLCTIINEFAINAKKHGKHGNDPVIVTVGVSRGPAHALHIVLSDNGHGLPKDFSFENSSGLGMLILTSTVEKLGGTIKAVDHASAAFEIALPA